MSDPRFTDPRMSDPRYDRPELGRSSGDVNAVWGWVAAAVFVAVVLLFVFASGNDNRNVASNGINMPPTSGSSSTTGAGPAHPGPPSAPGGAGR